MAIEASDDVPVQLPGRMGLDEGAFSPATSQNQNPVMTKAYFFLAGALFLSACQRAPAPISSSPVVAISASAPSAPPQPPPFAFPRGGLRLEYLFDPDLYPPLDALPRARNIIQNRLDAMGVETHVAITDKHLVVDVLGTTAERMEAIRAQIAVGKLEFREVDDSSIPLDKLPPGTQELPAKMPDGSTKIVRVLSGTIGPDQVEDAELRVNEWSVAVEVRLNAAGAAAFETLTRNNLDRPIAIVLGDKIMSMPIVKTPIAGGRVQITMGGADMDKQHADGEALVRALKAGALRGKLVLESEYIVRPQK